MIRSGDRMGELLVMMEENSKEFLFLSYPLNVIRFYDKEKFDFERKSNIIDYIEKLPNQVFKGMLKTYNNLKRTKKINQWENETLRSQIRKDENFNHRREQSSLEGTVGSPKHGTSPGRKR
jgi:hypothetical protein